MWSGIAWDPAIPYTCWWHIAQTNNEIAVETSTISSLSKGVFAALLAAGGLTFALDACTKFQNSSDVYSGWKFTFNSLLVED